MPDDIARRDLRVYAQAADAHVFHYREKDGLEREEASALLARAHGHVKTAMMMGRLGVDAE